MTERMGVREYARRIGVSHVAVLQAIKAGRLNKSVTRDDRKRPRINPAIADKEWGLNTDSDMNRNTEGAGGRLPAPPPKGQVELFPEAGETAPRSLAASFGGKTVQEWRAAQLCVSTKHDELDLAERQGRLTDVAKVKALWFKLVREARDRLLNVPSRIAGEVAAESDQKKVFATIDREIRLALEELTSDGQPTA